MSIRYRSFIFLSLFIALAVAAFNPFQYFGWYDEIYTIANMYFSGSWFNPASYNNLYASGSYLFESYPRVPAVIFITAYFTSSKLILAILMFLVRVFWYVMLLRQVCTAWSLVKYSRFKYGVILSACIVILLYDIYNWGWFFNGFGSAIFLTCAQLFLVNKVLFVATKSFDEFSKSSFEMSMISMPLVQQIFSAFAILLLGFFTVGSQDYYIFYAFALSTVSILFLLYLRVFDCRSCVSLSTLFLLLPVAFIVVIFATSSSTLNADLYARSIGYNFTENLLDMQYLRDVYSGLYMDNIFSRFFISVFVLSSVLACVGSFNSVRFSFVVLSCLLPAFISVLLSAFQVLTSMYWEDVIGSRILMLRANASAHTDGLIVSIFSLALVGYLIRFSAIPSRHSPSSRAKLLPFSLITNISFIGKLFTIICSSILFFQIFPRRVYSNFSRSRDYSTHMTKGFQSANTLASKTQCRRIVVHHHHSYNPPFLVKGFQLWLQSKPLNSIPKYTYLSNLVYKGEGAPVHPSNLSFNRTVAEVDTDFLRLAGVCGVVWPDGNFEFLSELENPVLIRGSVPIIYSSSIANASDLLAKHKIQILKSKLVVVTSVNANGQTRIPKTLFTQPGSQSSTLPLSPLVTEFASSSVQPPSNRILFRDEMHQRYRGYCFTKAGWIKASLSSANLVNILAECSLPYTRLKIFS